jgi:hypothetical protein
MAFSGVQNTQKLGFGGSMLGPVLLLWGLVFFIGFGFIWYSNEIGTTYRNFYVLPWVFIAAIVILAPSAYLYWKGRFDLFHPLVFAAWSYLFPAFVVGGVIVAFDWVEWFFISFIEDPQYNIPLTLVYISIGFLGLTAGYFLPVGRWFAERIEPLMPKREWHPDQVWLAGYVLIILGSGLNIFGFLQGLLGFQRNIEIGAFDGLISFLVIVLTVGGLILWLAVFTTKQRSGIFYLTIGLLLALIPLRMALLGSRSSLIIGLLPIAFAFYHSGRKIKWQYTAIFGFVATLALLIGVAYGTSFRNIKGSEARVGAGDYMGQAAATVDYLLDEDPAIVFGDTIQALANRVENLTSVAIVVSNYEKLAPYEAAYGLENNILNDLYTSFIPRFLWPEKPTTSDPRAYSDLYFSYGDNSFAISPFADLLRNFGPIGIPIGMMFLGFYLRFIYAALIETPFSTMWRKVAYFMLLTVVSYEAFFAIIFPSVIRTVFIIGVALILANLLLTRRNVPNA